MTQERCLGVQTQTCVRAERYVHRWDPLGMPSELSTSPAEEFTCMTWWTAWWWNQTEQRGRRMDRWMDVWCHHQTVGLTMDSAGVLVCGSLYRIRVCVCTLCSVHVYRRTSSLKRSSTSPRPVQGLGVAQSCYRSADVWTRAGMLLLKTSAFSQLRFPDKSISLEPLSPSPSPFLLYSAGSPSSWRWELFACFKSQFENVKVQILKGEKPGC